MIAVPSQKGLVSGVIYFAFTGKGFSGETLIKYGYLLMAFDLVEYFVWIA